LTQQRGGEWSSPERQQDLKYQERMKEFFAPRKDADKTPRNGALRHPFKDDTAVISPAERNGGGQTASLLQQPREGWRLREVPVAVLFALAALAVVVLAFWFVFLRGGEEAPQGSTPERAPAVAEGGPLEPRETGIVFQKPDEPQGGTGPYSLTVGKYTWEGTRQVNDDVEEVVLEGRTAAHFTTAVRLTDGEITTGVFGRAEPGKPLWHATFQRTTTIGEESTTGTYQAIDGGRVILEGAYTDRVVKDNPGDEPDDIVRTYVEVDPRDPPEEATRYAISIHAPEGTPIPWLVGWTPPDPVEEGE
jgi:hypothetical protein